MLSGTEDFLDSNSTEKRTSVQIHCTTYIWLRYYFRSFSKVI